MAELVDVFVQLGGHPAHLGLREPVDAQGFDQFVHPARGHAGKVAVSDHGDQGSLGALAALQEPVREVGASAQFRDRELDRAGAGVQSAVTVAIALRGPPRSGLAVLGADHRVGIRRQQRVQHGLQQAAHHVRRRFSKQLAKNVGRVDNMRSGHRDGPSREL